MSYTSTKPDYLLQKICLFQHLKLSTEKMLTMKLTDIIYGLSAFLHFRYKFVFKLIFKFVFNLIKLIFWLI